MTGIDKIEELLKKHLGENKTIVDIKSENLVGPGENYGGELFRLEIISRDDKTGTEEKVHAVAKKIPPNEREQKVFNIQQTFKGEINFYNKVVPTLQDFQRRNGIQKVIDCFPKLYGARINLEENSEVVDENAIIVLENLHTSGFSNLDRYVGYDFESAELLLRDLAALHAVPLAMKLREPEIFETQVKPYCNNSLDMSQLDESNHINFVSVLVQDILWESDKCSPFIPRVREILETEIPKAKKNEKSEAREPFATFGHQDLWINNAMIRIINGRPVANKFIDFQVYNYTSPASDLLLFLFTSVKQEVLQTDLDTLIQDYHSEFIRNLNVLGCDSSPFVMSNFEEELALESKYGLLHIMIFLTLIIYSEKNKIPKFEHRPDKDSSSFRNELRKSIHPKAKEKIWFTVQEFARKGWL